MTMENTNLTDQDGKPISGNDCVPGILIIEETPVPKSTSSLDIDTRFSETDEVRRVLTNKLLTAVQNAEINLNNGGKDATFKNEVAIQAISTLASLQNDRDKQATSKAKIKIAEEANQTDAVHAKAVTEFLRGYRKEPRQTDMVPDQIENIDQMINNTYQEHCAPLTEGELEITK